MFTSVIVGVDGREGGHAAIALAKQLAAPEAKFVFANFYGAEAPLARAHARVRRRRTATLRAC